MNSKYNGSTKTLMAFIGLILSLAFVGIMTWNIVSNDSNSRQKRLYYEGRVTAIVSDQSGPSYIYLNSNAQVVRINSGKVELVLGGEYRITTDGLGNLLNAEIIKEK